MKLLALLLLLCPFASALRCEPPPPDLLPVQLVVDGQVRGDALVAERNGELLILSSDLKALGATDLCADGAFQPLPYPVELNHAAMQLALSLPDRQAAPVPARPTQAHLGADLRATVQVDEQGVSGRAQLTWQPHAQVQVRATVTAGRAPGLNLHAQYAGAQADGSRVTAAASFTSGLAEPWRVEVTRTAPRAQAPPLIITAEQPGLIEVRLAGAVVYTGRYAAGRTQLETVSWPPVAGTAVVTLRERTGTRTLSVPVDLRRGRLGPGEFDSALTVQFGVSGVQLSGMLSTSPAPGVTITLAGGLGRDPGATLLGSWLAADGSQWSAQASVAPGQARLSVARHSDVTVRGSVQVVGGATEWTVGARAPVGDQVTADLEVVAARSGTAVRAAVDVREWPLPRTVTTASVTVAGGQVKGAVRLTWAPSPQVQVAAQSDPPQVSAAVRGRVQDWQVEASGSTGGTVQVSARGPVEIQAQLGARRQVTLSAGITQDGLLIPPGGPASLVVNLGVPGVPVTVGDTTLRTGPDGRAAFGIDPEQELTVRIDPDALPLGWTTARAQWRVAAGPQARQEVDLSGDLSREPLRRLPVPVGTQVALTGTPLTLLEGGYVLAPDARPGDLLDVTLPDGQVWRCAWSDAEVLTCAP